MITKQCRECGGERKCNLDNRETDPDIDLQIAQSLASQTIHLSTHINHNGEKKTEEEEKCNLDNIVGDSEKHSKVEIQ